MIELDDCGSSFTYHPYLGITAHPNIVMVIKTPRGTLALFNSQYFMDKQCEAIQSFMEEHRTIGDPLLYHMEVLNDTKKAIKENSKPTS